MDPPATASVAVHSLSLGLISVVSFASYPSSRPIHNSPLRSIDISSLRGLAAASIILAETNTMTTTMQSGGGGGEEQGVLAGRPPRGDGDEMEIGWPTDVRHVAHVTFDRFHGFRGVPEELLQQQQPGLGLGAVEDGVVRAPSASKTVFGVSTESMQCAYDGRGNSVPTVLLHLQRRLYDQGGLRAEGIFRVAADGAQEQYARDQLNNSGVVPDGVDVHCIAGLVKVPYRSSPAVQLAIAYPI